MELIDFLQEIRWQNIVVRDRVTVITEGNVFTGSLIPYTLIIFRDGQSLSNIIHERDGQLVIIVKTIPDGMGPDVGTPILISDVITITKEN